MTDHAAPARQVAMNFRLAATPAVEVLGKAPPASGWPSKLIDTPDLLKQWIWDTLPPRTTTILKGAAEGVTREEMIGGMFELDEDGVLLVLCAMVAQAEGIARGEPGHLPLHRDERPMFEQMLAYVGVDRPDITGRLWAALLPLWEQAEAKGSAKGPRK